MTRLEHDDPGRLALEPEVRESVEWRVLQWVLVAAIGFVVVLTAYSVWNIPSTRPHCPDGYALTGGGFSGVLHCEPGVPVEYR